MRNFKKLLVLSLLVTLFWPIMVNASEQFNLVEANSFLQSTNRKLENDRLPPSSLKDTFLKLEKLQQAAGKCVENTNEQIKTIIDLEKDTGIINVNAPANNDELTYVQNKKKQQYERLTACRLFQFKSQDTINEIKDLISTSTNNKVFAVQKPLWQVIRGDNYNFKELFFTIALIFTTIITAGFLWFLPRLNLIKVGGEVWKKPALLLYRVSILVAAGFIISLAIVGYGHLAVFLCQGALLTVGCVVIYAALVHLGNNILDQEKIHQGISLGKKAGFFEFTLFKFSLYALLAGWLVLVLLEWWGVSIVTLDQVKSFMVDGRPIYGINFIPMRLIIALMVFAIIQMVWKYALLYLSKVRHFDPEADSQIVITSLVSYLVLAIAILCGLAVSGVNFTGLAIIAGALSVGVGLGLQNIVNNFVSGVILLIEKPIKPGDRVLVQGREGFVKKISFRYTRILTLSNEDVIIPNSDIMSNPIVNFMFGDKRAKFKCQVGVSYDSDLELVKQTLLNIALKHPDVLRDPMNKPSVYMKEFGESNLLFELECVVNDINIKYRVYSELNMLIVNAFKENDIIMAFPQRDVHIKNQ